ncbi:hypothetical protein [Vibrio nomapromontoriensis]|uniref:hypothetical protein n=1 Tax=Vibrio nomapromontoriensis TaxID=2910246 RepID=UPI003D0D4F5E
MTELETLLLGTIAILCMLFGYLAHQQNKRIAMLESALNESLKQTSSAAIQTQYPTPPLVCTRQTLFEACIDVVTQHEPDDFAYSVKKVFPEHFQFRFAVYGTMVDDLSYFLEVNTANRLVLLSMNGQSVSTFASVEEFKEWLR